MILGSRHGGTGHWPNNRPSVRRENLKSGQQPSPHLWWQRHDDTQFDLSGGSSGGRLRKMVAKPLARRAANGDFIAAWGESRLPQSEVEGSASHSACLKGGVKRAQPCHGESPVRPSIRSDAASVRRSYRDDVPQGQVLTRLARAHATPQKLAERARMILLAAAGTGVRETAR